MHKQSQHTGFTIVELLVVIVVIGVLASIVTVVYSGSTIQARNAQQTAAAKAYYSLFGAYASQNGSFPPRSNDRPCLNLEQVECSTNTAYARDTTLEAALKTISTTLPKASVATPIANSPKMAYFPVTGSAYMDVLVDGVAAAILAYTVEAPGTCQVGSPASGSWPNLNSTAPLNGYSATSSTGSGTVRVCWVPLLKP